MEELFANLNQEISEYDKMHPTKVYPLEALVPSMVDFLNHVLLLCNSQEVDQIKTELIFSYDRVLVIKEGFPELVNLVNPIITNPKFLQALAMILVERTVSETDRYRVNRMFLTAVQQYSILSHIYPLYYALAKIVNAETITLLKGVVSEESAVLIAASYYSSYAPSASVGYLTYALSCINADTPLDNKSLHSIYDILVNGNFESLSAIFAYTIGDNSNRYSIPQFISRIKSVLLSMVEELPSYHIGIILNTFLVTNNYHGYEGLNTMVTGPSTVPPVPLDSEYISKFPKISNTVNYLKGQVNSKW